MQTDRRSPCTLCCRAARLQRDRYAAAKNGGTRVTRPIYPTYREVTPPVVLQQEGCHQSSRKGELHSLACRKKEKTRALDLEAEAIAHLEYFISESLQSSTQDATRSPKVGEQQRIRRPSKTKTATHKLASFPGCCHLLPWPTLLRNGRSLARFQGLISLRSPNELLAGGLLPSLDLCIDTRGSNDEQPHLCHERHQSNSRAPDGGRSLLQTELLHSFHLQPHTMFPVACQTRKYVTMNKVNAAKTIFSARLAD
jgi:hypothetical protein